jgi:hypothetical protein
VCKNILKFILKICISLHNIKLTTQIVFFYGETVGEAPTVYFSLIYINKEQYKRVALSREEGSEK